MFWERTDLDNYGSNEVESKHAVIGLNTDTWTSILKQQEFYTLVLKIPVSQLDFVYTVIYLSIIQTLCKHEDKILIT